MPMSKQQTKVLFTVVIFSVAIIAIAQQTSIRLPPDNAMAQLKSGTGEETARRDCGFCHSTDYIVIQPHLTAKQWDVEVQKMITVYGEVITPSDAKIISDYLAANYSNGSAPATKTETGDTSGSGKR